MDFLPSVIRATCDGGFRIRFTFNDDLQGTVDLKSWLEGQIFEPLKDRSYFQQFFVDGGTVVWPNGADIAPETAGAIRRSSRDRSPERTPCSSRLRSRHQFGTF